MVSNTGTYLDSPFHRYADGMDLAGLELKSLADLEGVLIHLPQGYGRSIDESCFAGLDVRGKAVLVHSSWARHWKTDQYFEGHSFPTEGAAQALKAGGA